MRMLVELRPSLGFRASFVRGDMNKGKRSVGVEIANLEIGHEFLSSSWMTFGLPTMLERPSGNAPGEARQGTSCGENAADVIEIGHGFYSSEA
jgi:hypothetical protein